MTSTTHSDYNSKTEALEVAQAFASRIHGKTVLITGVNSKGIGYSTAEAFASQSPAHIIIAGRTPAKLEESIGLLKKSYPNIDCRPLQLNLASQKDVRAAAKEFLSWQDVPKLDIIVNSAGIMALPERTLTEDGIEAHFGTNYLGHFLFTNLIMPKLIAAASGNEKGATRIINVSSMSATVGGIRWSDINFDKISTALPEAEQPDYAHMKWWGTKDPETKSYIPIEGYGQSKRANVLFSIGASKRLFEKHGILSLSLHPGVIQTELQRSFAKDQLEALEESISSRPDFFRSQGAGASTSLVAALDPKLTMPENKGDLENWGVYLIDCQISEKLHPRTRSSAEADKLWNLGEELVKEKFSW